MHGRRYSIGGIAIKLIVGGVFTSLAIALVVLIISNVIKHGFAQIGAAIILPLLLILIMLVFGCLGLYMGGKDIYRIIKGRNTDKFGINSTAKIVYYKSAHYSKNSNTNIRYSLVLSYYDCGEEKTFTTDYLFDINEFRYLQELDCVKIKIHKNFVNVCEEFSEDIYVLDSRYGIERAFFKQKSVKILSRLWLICFIAAFVFLIVSIVIENSICAKIAVPIIFIIHIPFAIAFAVYLIKWFRRKK